MSFNAHTRSVTFSGQSADGGYERTHDHSAHQGPEAEPYFGWDETGIVELEGRLPIWLASMIVVIFCSIFWIGCTTILSWIIH